MSKKNITKVGKEDYISGERHMSTLEFEVDAPMKYSVYSVVFTGTYTSIVFWLIATPF
jgi:hypothetical protein